MQLARQPEVSSFAGTLAGYRQAAGLSQRALARRSELTAAYLSLLEAGRGRPGRGTVERLATALDLADADRATLLLAAGYAPTGGVGEATAGPLAEAESVLADASFTPEQRATIASLVAIYTRGLAARVRAGKPLVSDLAAPWQVRVLEAMEEKMAEDFESFRAAYLYPSFDL